MASKSFAPANIRIAMCAMRLLSRVSRDFNTCISGIRGIRVSRVSRIVAVVKVMRG